MKLQFKHQPFQAEAADAVCDVFCGQPYRTVTYRRDLGDLTGVQISTYDTEVGFRNQPFVPELTNRKLLDNLRAVQRRNGLKPSDELTGPGANLSIEMETGTGKTYTYVKTMYELNKRYGWSKFIIVVPSVAIREGVYKSLQTTQEHFAGEYNKKIRFFIYNSDRLTEVDRFASDSAINVMIINMQAFNSSKNQRIIDKKLDTFRSRKPIDIIAKTNPILIIDEPTSQLDPQGTESVFEIIKMMKDKKKTIILVEHKIDLIAEYADEVLVLRGGKLIAGGDKAQVLSDISLMEQGVQLPQMAILGSRLKEKGFPISEIPVTEKRAVEIISAALNGRDTQ